MLSLNNGYQTEYLTKAVAGGREGYYTNATLENGEPPGVWYGGGASELGLRGEVDTDAMERVYGRFLDPRHPDFRSSDGESEADRRLGNAPPAFRTADEVYSTLIASEPDASPERRNELKHQAERTARQAVMFIDATFSAPKSVSVVACAFERLENDAVRAADRAAAAGDGGTAAEKLREAEAWRTHRERVEAAVMAGARAAIDYLQEHAGYTRVGHHGGNAGRWTDAHRFTVAQFLQHDSRDRDPQLHVHNAILNRVQTPDGKWLTLDSRAIHRHRGAAGAVAERVMEAHLARDLGLRIETRADGKAREIVGVPADVIDLFSQRRRALTGRLERLVRDFKAVRGREPTQLERHHLAQQATLETRKGKQHGGETTAERIERWEREARGKVAGGLARVAHAALAAGREQHGPEHWSPTLVIARALDRVSAGGGRQTWTRPDLTRAISDELPGRLGVAPDRVEPLLDRLTNQALQQAVVTVPAEPTRGLPEELRLRDGRSAYQEPAGQRFCTVGQVAAELVLLDAAVERGPAAMSEGDAADVADRYAANGRELGADQRAAVTGILSDGARVKVLTAAAGSGKSFVTGAIAEARTEHGLRTVGLASSQVATDVLAGEGLNALNITQWRAAQDRIENNRARAGDEHYRLRPGDMIVVDEAGMAATGDVANIVQRARAAGAEVLLVGDDRQLAAVGPGGALADVGARAMPYRLVEVRRFKRSWEGEASLRLRQADPSALDLYDRYGHIRAGGTSEQTQAAAARAWLADTIAGHQSVLVVNTNEEAAQVAAQLRAELVALGRVEADGVPLGRDGTVAGVGDVVQARRNGWAIAEREGNTRAPINRETYTVVGRTEDGGLTVRDAAGVDIRLPAEYVRDHLALSYASTVHGVQGRTVDTSHSIVTPASGAAAVYVSATRGTDGNTMWVVTKPTASEAPPGEAAEVKELAARDVVASVLEKTVDERGALAETEHAAEEADSEATHVDRLADGIGMATAGRTGDILDELVHDGTLSAQDRTALAADRNMAAVERLVRSAEVGGRDPREVLRSALAPESLSGARSPAQVLHARIRERVGEAVGKTITSFRELIPTGLTDSWRRHLERTADDADARRQELGTRTAQEAPEWATSTLGPVPADPVARLEWEQRAGWAAAEREQSRHDDAEVPLASAPAPGLAEKHALWATAHTALRLPDVGPEEAGMSDGRLLARVEAFERERVWAPRWVGDEMAATAEEAAQARANATMWDARAHAADTGDKVPMTDDERAELARQAAEARAEADRLDALHTQLQEVDRARAHWYAHTATTRDTAERAAAALNHRGVDPHDMPDRTTAEEWLAAHEAEQAADERGRPVRDTDVVDEREELPSAYVDEVETNAADIRDTAEEDPTERRDPYREVADPDTTDEAVIRARDALAEIEARHRVDEAHGLDDADAEEVAWWAQHPEDEVDDADAGDDGGRGRERTDGGSGA